MTDVVEQQGTVEPGDGPPRRTQIDAAELYRDLIKHLEGGLLRRGARAPVFELSNCSVSGQFSLRGASVGCLLRFRDCTFEFAPDVREALVLGLSFVDCWMPGLKARNLRSRNDVRLIGCTVRLDQSSPDKQSTTMGHGDGRERGVPDTAVNLTDAVIEGSVVLTRTEIDYPSGEALRADRLQVSGAVLGYWLRASGELRIPGLRTGGNLNLSGARLSRSQGLALDGTGMHIGGSMLGELARSRRTGDTRPFTARGAVYIPGARIDGDLVLRGAELTIEPDGPIAVDAWRAAAAAGDRAIDPWPAIFADRLRVEGNVEWADGFRSNGTLRMINGVIGGSLRLADATIEVKRRDTVPHYDRALHIDGSEISGDVHADRLAVRGQLRMSDVTIGGNLLARGAALTNPERGALTARRSRVAGNVKLPDAQVSGTLQMQTMDVGGAVDLRGSLLTDPALRMWSSYSLELQGSTVGRDIMLANHAAAPFTALGGVSLDEAKVARRVNLSGAVLHSLPASARSDLIRGIALNASDVVADQFLLTPNQQPQGKVVLRGASCRTLTDNVALWRASGGVDLDDFRYDALSKPVHLADDAAVEERIRLLSAAMRGYRPGPYDQLAAMLKTSGNEEHAWTVLLRKQQHRYDALSRGAGWLGPGVRAWSWLQRAVVGYGYRPTRALAWLLVLLVVGSLWFGLLPDSCVEDQQRFTVSGPRCVVNADDTGLEWNPVLHTADLLVPIVDFGNKGRWHMGGADNWVATGFTATGWILATTVAAGLTRMLRRS